MLHASCFMLHASCFMLHASCFMLSCFMLHASCFLLRYCPTYLYVGSVLTLLNASPYQFVSVNLTNGAVVATATPAGPGDASDFEFLQINNNLVLVSYQNSTSSKNYYSFLTLSPLSATPYHASEFYRTWMYSSFVVNATTGQTYLCAVNPYDFYSFLLLRLFYMYLGHPSHLCTRPSRSKQLGTLSQTRVWE
jgi:hypothetical protein